MERPIVLNPAARPRNDGVLLVLLMLPAVALGGLSYLAGFPQGAYAIVGTAFLAAVIASPEIGLYVYFLIQAFDQAFVESHEAVFTPSKALAPLIIAVYLLRPERALAPIVCSRPYIMAMLGFGLYGIVMAVFSLEPLASVRYGGQIIVQVILIVVALHRLVDRERISRALLFTVASGTLAAIVMIATGGRSEQFSRATLGEFTNPNTAALAISLSLLSIPAAWAFTTHRLVRAILLCCAPLMLTAMLMTGSRSALVATAVAALLATITARGLHPVLRFVIPAVGATVILVTGLLVLQSGLLQKQSQERIEAFVEGREGRQEARYFIWIEALSTFAQQPWGFGYGNTAFAMEKHRGFFLDIHSTYLSALVDGGPVSVGLFVFGLGVLFTRMRLIRAPGAAVGASTLVWYVLVSGITHTIHFSKWFWIPVTLTLVMAEFARRQQLAAAAAPRAFPVDYREPMRGLQPAVARGT